MAAPCVSSDAALPLAAWRAQLNCGFPAVAAVFEDCMRAAKAQLSPQGMHDFLEQGRYLARMGRGPEPILIFLEEWPVLAQHLGESMLEPVMQLLRALNRSPNGAAIAPCLQSLVATARRLASPEQMQRYLELSQHLMEETSGSIHGAHKSYASPGLPEFFRQTPLLLEQVPLGGLAKWVEYGIRHYRHHPPQQREYFSLQLADSRAVLQRQRHGTLLVDHLRGLDLYLLALWRDTAPLVPCAAATLSAQGEPIPYVAEDGMRLPDVYAPRQGVSGLDRYRAALAHMAAHRRWSTPQFADNFSPLQRLAIECFEDARVEALAMRLYPGLRRSWTALHQIPQPGACDPLTHSCLRHRLAMLSRALLDPAHAYVDPDLLEFVRRFQSVLTQGQASTADMVNLGLAYVARTRRQSDQLAQTFFDDTLVDYRDDNRHLWRYHELSDDEEMFESPRQRTVTEEHAPLPPRHYPEWDYTSQSYRPDWVSLYERLHPAGQSSDVDRILAQHAILAKQLRQLLDRLKPQQKARQRYQEDGSELDLDVAIRSLIDWRAHQTPETRIHMGHRHDGRSIAVLLLLDLSESLNAKIAGSARPILDLSREAVCLLAWAVDQLGDRFAIAGFHSNTRHEVRYLHLKGFSEAWNDEVKARLAGLQAGYSTRMGAALRHAAHYLQHQQADKKLMLVLTDGRPSDVDATDPHWLVADARQAVRELDQKGIFTYGINLDPHADAYVRDIFGHRYSVIDRVEHLPEQLPRLFMSLTR